MTTLGGKVTGASGGIGGAIAKCFAKCGAKVIFTDDPGFVEAVVGFTPMGCVAQPEEMRGLAIMLASEASNFMCGQMFVIDGGCLAK